MIEHIDRLGQIRFVVRFSFTWLHGVSCNASDVGFWSTMVDRICIILMIICVIGSRRVELFHLNSLIFVTGGRLCIFLLWLVLTQTRVRLVCNRSVLESLQRLSRRSLVCKIHLRLEGCRVCDSSSKTSCVRLRESTDKVMRYVPTDGAFDRWRISVNRACTIYILTDSDAAWQMVLSRWLARLVYIRQGLLAWHWPRIYCLWILKAVLVRIVSFYR